MRIIFVYWVDVFPHFILVKPYWIRISFYEFILIHSFNRLRALDSYLFAIHENPHVLLSTFCFCQCLGALLRSSELPF